MTNGRLTELAQAISTTEQSIREGIGRTVEALAVLENVRSDALVKAAEERAEAEARYQGKLQKIHEDYIRSTQEHYATLNAIVIDLGA